MSILIWLAVIAEIAIIFLLLQRFTSLEFVSHAKLLFKAWSVWLASAGATLCFYLLSAPDALLNAWAVMPEEIKSLIPQSWMAYIGPGLVILGVVAQFVRQPKLLEQKRRMEKRP